MTDEELYDFIRESNKIEGIIRAPYPNEISAHQAFLKTQEVTTYALKSLVSEIQPGAELREIVGPQFNVPVGSHKPIPGGPRVRAELESLLVNVNAVKKTPHQVVGDTLHYAFMVHLKYETLHPFTDGNGRSGRALWLWQVGDLYSPYCKFLHQFYYSTLAASRQFSIA